MRFPSARSRYLNLQQGLRRLVNFRIMLLWLTILLSTTFLTFEDATSAIKAKYGGTIRLVLETDPLTLDPVNTMHPEEYFILLVTGNRLVQYNGDRLMPGLARNWSVSPDGKKWTINLFQNVSFHSGKICDSKSVIHSLERLKGSPYSWILEQFQTMEPKSGYSLTITLKKPDWAFMSWMTLFPTSIVSPWNTSVDKKVLSTTGPFQISKWVHNRELVLNGNTAYFHGAPFLEEIVITFNPRIDYHFDKYRLNKLDLIFLPLKKIPSTSPEFLKQNTWKTTSRFSLACIGLNPRVPILKSVEFRRKIASAIDKKSIISTILRNEGSLASGLLPPTYFSASNLVDDPFNKNIIIDHTRHNSQNKSITLEMIVPSSPVILSQVADRIKVNLMDMGVALKTSVLDLETYRHRLTNGEYDLCYYLWIPPSKNPIAALMAFTFSNPISNQFFKVFPELREEFLARKNTIVQTKDPDARKIKTGLFEKKLLQLVSIIPLYHENIGYVYQKRLINLEVDPRGFFILENLWISPGNHVRTTNKTYSDPIHY